MGLRTWYNAQDSNGKMAILSGAGVILAAAVAGGFAVAGTLAATQPVPLTCPRGAKISAPQAGQHVAGLKGVEVKGLACGLRSGESIWMVEFDAYDGNYYLVYNPDVGVHPVLSGNGSFAMEDQPIGDPGDDNKTYTISVILASKQCSTAIMAKRIDKDGNYTFKPLPAGCVVADQVDILETQPSSPPS